MFNFSLSNIQKWLLAFSIAAILTILLYTPDAHATNGFWFLTFLAIALFAFEPIPTYITATMLMLLFVVFGISPPDVSFAGWTTFIPWLMLSGLFIGRIIETTGFANRIALNIIKSVARTPLLLFLSFLLVGYVLNFIIADGFTNTIVLATFAIGICKALELKPDSKGASCIILAVYFGAFTVGANFLPNGLGAIGTQMLKSHGIEVGWTEFLLDNFSLVFITSLSSMLLVYFYGRKEIAPNIDKAQEFARTECIQLDCITKEEIKAIGLLVCAVAFMVLEPFHGLNGLFGMAAFVLLAFCPPFNLLGKNDINEVQVGMLFFMTGCMAIGMTAVHLGIPAWLNERLIPILSGVQSTEGAALFAYCVGVLANFVLTPIAASSSLSIPMSDLAVEMGFAIKPLIYSFFIGLDQWLFPYELAPAIFLFSTGYVRLKHIFVILGLRVLMVGGIVWLNAMFMWG